MKKESPHLNDENNCHGQNAGKPPLTYDVPTAKNMKDGMGGSLRKSINHAFCVQM